MLTGALYGRRSVPAKQEFKPHDISQPAKQVVERVSAEAYECMFKLLQKGR